MKDLDKIDRSKVTDKLDNILVNARIIRLNKVNRDLVKKMRPLLSSLKESNPQVANYVLKTALPANGRRIPGGDEEALKLLASIIAQPDRFPLGQVAREYVGKVRKTPTATIESIKSTDPALYQKFEATGVHYKEHPIFLASPDFSPYAVEVPAPLQGGLLTGDVDRDIDLLNVAKSPEGFVWHHLDDCRSMILIPKAIHSMNHGGGRVLIANGLCP